MGSTSHDLSGEDASPRTHQFVDIPPGDEDVEPVWSDAKEEVGALTMPKISVQTSGTRHTVLDEIGGQEGGDKSRQIAMIHGESRFVGFGSCSNSQLPQDGFLFQPLMPLSEHRWTTPGTLDVVRIIHSSSESA